MKKVPCNPINPGSGTYQGQTKGETDKRQTVFINRFLPSPPRGCRSCFSQPSTSPYFPHEESSADLNFATTKRQRKPTLTIRSTDLSRRRKSIAHNNISCVWLEWLPYVLSIHSFEIRITTRTTFSLSLHHGKYSCNQPRSAPHVHDALLFIRLHHSG